MCSWNIGSLHLRWQQLLTLDWQLVCLQETGATLRQQKFLDSELRRRGISAVWGKATPVGWNRNSRCRSQTGAIPGVAILASESLNIRYRRPLTASGRRLEERGRLIAATYCTPVTQVLLVSVYLPSGGTASVVQDRRGCLSDVLDEVAAYGDVPIVLTGDWNLEPEANSLVPILLSKRWIFPLSDFASSGSTGTYASGGTSSHLDYALVSPSLPVMVQKVGHDYYSAPPLCI